jgi:phage shock protein C
MVQMADRKMMRSANDKMVAGVAAGLANYFDLDPVIVRLIFVVMALLGGHGILVYIIMWIIMPEAPRTDLMTDGGAGGGAGAG